MQHEAEMTSCHLISKSPEAKGNCPRRAICNQISESFEPSHVMNELEPDELVCHVTVAPFSLSETMGILYLTPRFLKFEHTDHPGLKGTGQIFSMHVQSQPKSENSKFEIRNSGGAESLLPWELSREILRESHIFRGSFTGRSLRSLHKRAGCPFPVELKTCTTAATQ
jgi:hypothetical protein